MTTSESISIVSGIRSGDSDAIATLFRTVWSWRKAWGEDTCQQAIFYAWRAIASGELKDPAALGWWLYRTCWHLSLQAHRDSQRWDQWEDWRWNLLPTTTTPESLALGSEQVDHMTQSVGQLTPMLRVVMDAYLADEDDGVSAAALGVQRHTIAVHRHRAIQQLRASCGQC